MELVWFIYIADTLTVDGQGLHWLVFNSVIITGVLLWVTVDPFYSESTRSACKTPFKISLAVTLLLIVYSVFVPTKDTAYKMLAAYGIYEVSQSEDVQRLTGKSLELLELTMDKHLTELKKD